jgi:uncharacterized protein with HEPN domain
MWPRNWKERIRDILDAIAEIQTFVANVRFEEFQDDMKTIRAVELDLIIIGNLNETIDLINLPMRYQKNSIHKKALSFSM